MLRDEYAAQTRQRIIEAFIALLEESEDSSIATSALAKRAGVSLRTVYRYFPSRDALLTATAEWLNTEVFGLASQDDPKGVVKGFQVAVGKFDSRPDLARILALTRIGRSLRSTFRNELASRRRTLLWTDTPGIPAPDRVRAEAVLACLDNVQSWLTLREEFDMDAKEIGAAIGWAMELVLNETRRSAQTKKKKP